MSIKNILVPLGGTDRAKPAMSLGLSFGRDLGAHVDVLHVRSDPKETIPLLGEGMSVSMIEDMIGIAEKEGGERAVHGRGIFDQLARELSLPISDKPPPTGPTASWSEETGREDEIVARRGRLADLIVVSRPTQGSEGAATLALNAALFDTGRPVLVAPPQETSEIGRHIAISWNGSAESARAVSSAMSLITAADKVTVLTVASDVTSAARGPELATYLEWHGVFPLTQTFEASGQQTIGAALLGECMDAGADLLVMGAYTHSRMRQMILGGVTRHVLGEATIPLFMAH